MQKKTKHTLLKGEGINQHTLYGDFKIGNEEDYTNVIVEKESELKHEQPNGKFAEHNGLMIEKGANDWYVFSDVTSTEIYYLIERGITNFSIYENVAQKCRNHIKHSRDF